MNKKLTRRPCVLVCVTPQQSCSRLIEAGARIAKENNMPLHILSVFAKKDGMSADAQALETLYECSRGFDSQMSVYFNDDPFLVAAVVAKRENAHTLVAGFPATNSEGFIAKLHEILPELPITMVDGESNEYRILPPAAPKVPRPVNK